MALPLGELTHDNFLTQKADKAAVLARFKATESSLWKLPNEVIIMIFSRCTSIVILGSYFIRPSRRLKVVEPWNLSHVCSAWREIALGTPALWNNIILCLDKTKEEECARQSSMLQLCLSRTRSSLISLRIQGSPPLLTWNTTGQLIVDSVRLCISRVHHLSLGSLVLFQHIFAKLPRGIAGSLASLSVQLSCEREDARDNAPSDISIVEAACHLRNVTIPVGNVQISHLIHFSFPWACITELEITAVDKYAYDVTFVEGHGILGQCKSLVSCTLTIPPDEACLQALVHPSDTVLEKLQSLTLMANYHLQHGLFLQPFVLPALKCLKILSKPWASWSSEALISLIQRSLCLLEHLESRCAGSDEISGLLSEVPSLLEMSLWDLKPHLAEEMLTAIGNGDVVPRLRGFQCEIKDAGVLLDMLEEDSTPFKSIKSLLLHGNPERAPEGVRDSLYRLLKRRIVNKVVDGEGISRLVTWHYDEIQNEED